MNPKQATLDGRYAPRDGNVLAKQVAQEMVIVDMQSGDYHGLNAVGAEIWQRLDGQRPLDQIVEEQLGRYPDVDRNTIEADTLTLIQALLDHGLVVAR